MGRNWLENPPITEEDRKEYEKFMACAQKDVEWLRAGLKVAPV